MTAARTFTLASLAFICLSPLLFAGCGDTPASVAPPEMTQEQIAEETRAAEEEARRNQARQ